MSTLFVGNLSFDTGEEDLIEFFSSGGYAPDSVRIITSQGKSKGYVILSILEATQPFYLSERFYESNVRSIHLYIATCRYGYAEFNSAQQAKKALDKLTGSELSGRELRLDMATPRSNAGGTPRGGRGTPRGGRGGGRGAGPSPGPTNKLFVRNLWLDTEPYTLEELFPEANDVYLPKDRETGKRRG